MKSWHHEYQVSAKDREKTQLEYEIKKDLEELEAGRAQENAYNVWIENIILLKDIKFNSKCYYCYSITLYKHYDMLYL